MENKNLRNSLGLFTGAMGVQLADMARGVFTGKGDAWLPNSWAEKYKNIKNASTANWWKSAPTQAARLALRAGSVPAVGAGAYLGTNAIMDSQWGDEHGIGRNDFKEYGGNIFNAANSVGDFLIDNAKSAGTIAKDLYNKDLPFGLSNLDAQVTNAAQAFAGTQLGQIETNEQKEWMKNHILNSMANTGSYSGGVDYRDYDPGKGTKTLPDTSNGLGTQYGYLSPQAAYQNTLGRGSFTVPQGGGQVQWTPESTKWDGLGNNAVGNIVDAGGLLALSPLAKKSAGGPIRDDNMQYYTPDITITDEDAKKKFGGATLNQVAQAGAWDNQLRSSQVPSMADHYIDKNRNSWQEQSQPTGTSATALAQIQANISAAATKEKLLNKKQSIAPIDRTKKTTAASGMMSSGPPRRSSRRGRKKPAKTNFGRRYGL